MPNWADYAVEGANQQQQGLANMQAKRERDAELDRPLPQYTQDAYNPPAPVSPASAYSPDNSGQFDNALNATGQGISGLAATDAPAQGGYGSGKPRLLDQSSDQGQFEHPAVKHFADRVASGELDPHVAAAAAKRHIYTNRDLPALEAGDKALMVRNSARDRTGEINARNEGNANVARIRADSASTVADMQTRQRRDSTVIQASASMYRTDAMLKKAIEDNKSREKQAAARGQKVPDHVGQQLKGLQLQLEGAGKELASATQEYNSITTLAATQGDSGKLADAHRRIETAQAKMQGIESAVQQLMSGGGSGTSDGGTPFEMRIPPGGTDPAPSMAPTDGAPNPEYQFDQNSPAPVHPVRGGTPNNIGAPNMNAVPGGPPPATNSGRPVQAFPQSNTPVRGAVPSDAGLPPPQSHLDTGGGVAAAQGGAQATPVGTTTIRRKADGKVKSIPTARAIQMVQSGEFELVR